MFCNYLHIKNNAKFGRIVHWLTTLSKPIFVETNFGDKLNESKNISVRSVLLINTLIELDFCVRKY